MTSSKQRNEGALDDRFLADNNLAQLGPQPGVGFVESLDLSFGGHSPGESCRLKVAGYRFFRATIAGVGDAGNL